MGSKRKYPYLGIFEFPMNKEMSYVVLFNSENTGTIVSTTITDTDQFSIGKFSTNWDESMFSYLDPSIVIKLNND